MGVVKIGEISGLQSALDAKASYADLINSVKNAGIVRLTNVAGSANAVTADISPSVHGYSFHDDSVMVIDWPATNTAASPTVTVAGYTITLSGIKIGQLTGGRSYLIAWVTKTGYDAIGHVMNPELRPYLAPSDFSSTIPVGNVRDFGSYKIAIRNDGFSYDVRQNRGGTEAFIQHADDAIFLPVYGQSNAGAQGPGIPDGLYTGNAYPQIAASFANSVRMYGDTAATEADFYEIAPITDTGHHNQFVANTAAQALEHGTRARDFNTTPGIIGVSVYEGNKPLPAFTDGAEASGHYNFENLMKAARAAKTVAEDYGRTINCPAVVYIQGENGPPKGYASAVQILAASVTANIKAEMSLSAPPRFLIVQTNSADATSMQKNIAKAKDQIDSHGVGNILVAGPMYQFPLQDTIHVSPTGKLMMGDMLGDVLRVLRNTGTWTPLKMASAVRSGAVITVTFDVPAGNIAFDTDWVKAVANQGFFYADDSMSASISSVKISGAATVEITLDATPTGAGPVVQYALYSNLTSDGWANGRGTLYSPSVTPSLYYQMGYSVPSTVRHYACRQEISVTI